MKQASARIAQGEQISLYPSKQEEFIFSWKIFYIWFNLRSGSGRGVLSGIHRRLLRSLAAGVPL
jgi:hypothetical protein